MSADPTSTARSDSDRARGSALAHVIFNALLAIGFALLFWRAGDLPASMWEPLGSGSFPRLVLGALICFNLAIIVEQLRRLPHTSALAPGSIRRWLWQHRLALAVLALLTLYLLALPWLGFALASLSFLLATQILLGARSPRRLGVAGVIALVFSFGLAWVFADVFGIMLPAGVLG
ncbi:tripartite tricarboxylate transporter TctB family protein [Kushneria sinocarnis]|uniref:Tripartite tricarboxylate transporter TctB family protein n=1 Tax=Kushneria sinocarnis TaxID=595502 RepID=A0A420WZI3_9GAMM|nr:tripartite tricarboxylate transporter TctB family protein [Kushneria sinocarnis]RKR06756.1 tripartite tricarboxylate transporter TctB family protein [Kushneria sinocarnis]